MKVSKKVLSLLLCTVIVLITVSIGINGFSDILSVFSINAIAKTVTNFQVGDIVEFGWYPQSEVKDAEIVSALNSLAGDNKNWTSYNYCSGTGTWNDGQMKSYDYMRYKDLIYGSDKYRGVIIDRFRPYYIGHTSSIANSYQDDNGYVCDIVYWFKYEPIKWQILDPETGVAIAKTVLDSQSFNNYILSSGIDEYGETAFWGDSSKTYYANNYEKSSIRNWLNSDFYNTAFSFEQQKIIEYTLLDNSAFKLEKSAYNAKSTNDKIYLLSCSDALNVNYGFSSNMGIDSTRQAEGSDYAKCQGVYVFTNDHEPNLNSEGFSPWLFRSPGVETGCAYSIDYGGSVNDALSYDTALGIRPAISFNLESDIFQSDVKDAGSMLDRQKCGENLTWSLDKNGVLTINGNGDMRDFKINDSSCWLENKDAIKSVIIEKGVTSVGSYAFFECKSIESVLMPDSITVIGVEAFNGCSNLVSVNIPENVLNIREAAFVNCSSIKKIKIPGSVKKISGSYFWGCTSLTEVILEEGIEELSEMFYDSPIKEISIPSSIMALGNFRGNEELEAINVNENNKNFSSIDGILFNKDQTELLACPQSKIGDFTIPDSVIKVEEHAFIRTSLSSVTISKNVITLGDDPLFGSTKIESINVSEENKNYSSVDGVLFNKAQNELIHYPGGKKQKEYTIPSSVNSIKSFSFAGSDLLETINIPETTTEISENSFYTMAGILVASPLCISCSNLTEIKVSSNNLSYCDVDGVLFNKELTELICYPVGKEQVEYTIPDGVLKIDNSSFINCHLNYVTLPDGLECIDDYAFFDGCLKELNLPTTLTDIGEAAFSNNNITSIVISGKMVSLNDLAFSANDISSIIIGDGVKYIDSSAFKENEHISSVHIPASVISISPKAFGNMNVLICSDNENGYLKKYAEENGYTYKVCEGHYFVLNFDPNGGYCPDETKSVEYGALFGNLPVPVKYGYHFDGWYIGDKKITDTDVVTGSATLLAKWKTAIYPQKYDFNSQKWTFKNRYERIPEEVFVNAYGKTIGSALYNALGNLEIGHCYGMSLSTGYILNDDMDFSVENEKLINYGQVYQYCPNAILNTKTINKYTVDDFVKAVKDYVNGVDDPVAVGFYTMFSGHEVLAVGIEETNDDYLIYVDDSENRNTLGTITLNKSGTEWSYNINKDYSSSKGYFLDYSTDTIEFSSMKDYYFAVKYEFVSAPGSWKNKRTNSIIRVSNRAGDSSAINNIFWNLAGEKIEMENTDNESGELIVCGQTNQIKAVVEENGEISVQTQNDGKDSNIELKGTDKFEITYSSVTESGNDTEITFSGTIAEDGISLNQEVNNFNIDGCSNCAIEITKNDEILLRENFDNVSESLNLSVDVGEDIPKISIIGVKNNVSVGYKSTVILHRSEIVSSEYDAYWYVNGKCKGNEKDLILNEVTEDLTVELCVTDKEGNVLTKSQTQHIKVKKTFFDKLIWFFKHLFGINTVFDQK